MPFEAGADGGQVDGLHVGHEEHQVRIAHRHELSVAETVAVTQVYRPQVAGSAHVYGHRGDASVGARMEDEGLDAGESVQGDGGPVGQALVVDVLADAAGGVAAHAGLGTVGVEDAHAEVGHVRAAYQHQPVAADARVWAAPCHGEFAGVLERVTGGVYIDVVIAGSVHLRKAYLLYHFVYL